MSFDFLQVSLYRTEGIIGSKKLSGAPGSGSDCVRITRILLQITILR
jgi:hypothetical protein